MALYHTSIDVQKHLLSKLDKNNRYIFVWGLRLSVYVKLMRSSCSLPLHEVDVSDFDFNGGRCPWTCHVATCKMSDCANNATQLFPKYQKWIGYLRDSVTSLHSSVPTLVHALLILGMKPSGLQEKIDQILRKRRKHISKSILGKGISQSCA